MSRYNKQAVAAHHSASYLGRGDLALVKGHECQHQADANSIEKAADKEHGDVNRAPLNSAGNDTQHVCPLDGLHPAQPVR
jgi:hypothetical protein